jgi:hypothetical protein
MQIVNKYFTLANDFGSLRASLRPAGFGQILMGRAETSRQQPVKAMPVR